MLMFISVDPLNLCKGKQMNIAEYYEKGECVVPIQEFISYLRDDFDTDVEEKGGISPKAEEVLKGIKMLKEEKNNLWNLCR
jgi:hypothetical protein